MGSFSSKKKDPPLEDKEVNFDHFQVLRSIGKGSFGKVCIVQKKSSKQMYAMKYMNKAQCKARDATTSVLTEIDILASLSHPFLVNLWYSFQDCEDVFMVVDLLVGGDLRYHTQQGVQFAEEDIRLYICEVAHALTYLKTKKIIHRDIKPDNLLLDEVGHVHLTDFNTATILDADYHLPNAMAGTKPYMAPEVLDSNSSSGYSYPVDWWSLGVTAYELRCGLRPYDIHSNTPLQDIHHMLQKNLSFPRDCHPGLEEVILQLLRICESSRISNLEDLQKIQYVSALDQCKVLNKSIKSKFTPPADRLNCDPTFELEEMIIESRPLHKKKKRLSKEKKNSQQSADEQTDCDASEYSGLLVFNREALERRKEREKREREWQNELEISMEQSDPTGHGCSFSGLVPGDNCNECSRSCSSVKEMDMDKLAVDSGRSSTFNSAAGEKPAPSPESVKARIARSPKVVVRGSTVTIESSGINNRSSTQQLKMLLSHFKFESEEWVITLSFFSKWSLTSIASADYTIKNKEMT
ncbi:unnamed protein product, partial [Meganyctiphanes norvegica]